MWSEPAVQTLNFNLDQFLERRSNYTKEVIMYNFQKFYQLLKNNQWFDFLKCKRDYNYISAITT